MKVEYNDEDGALRFGKIKVRLRLDKSKIEVRWRLDKIKIEVRGR